MTVRPKRCPQNQGSKTHAQIQAKTKIRSKMYDQGFLPNLLVIIAITEIVHDQ